jgi:DNA-binding MarR family transcriptional regulator
MKPKSSVNEGRFAYEGLDRVIHERARLSVSTSLITNPKGLTFGDLEQLCSLTDGNLSRHLQVLEKAKLVEIVKGHDRNRPQTLCRITPSGRKRYLEYLPPSSRSFGMRQRELRMNPQQACCAA